MQVQSLNIHGVKSVKIRETNLSTSEEFTWYNIEILHEGGFFTITLFMEEQIDTQPEKNNE
jgi:hypothetical protein